MPSAPIVLDDAVIRVLGEVGLFSGLTRMQLIWLLSAVTRFDVPANSLFFDEGEAGDKLYVLIVGAAVVEKSRRDSPETSPSPRGDLRRDGRSRRTTSFGACARKCR